MPLLGRALTVAVALLNIADALLHVAIDQVEPLRIAGNAVVVVAALGMLAIPGLRRPMVPIVAGLTSLALNVVFIVVAGIGGLGAVLIALTTILLAVVAGALREPHRSGGTGF